MLTWVKTAGIKKEFSQLGVKAHLTTLLLRDGECTLLYLMNYMNHVLHRHHIFLVSQTIELPSQLQSYGESRLLLAFNIVNLTFIVLQVRFNTIAHVLVSINPLDK